LKGNHVTRISSLPEYELEPSFSPNGKWIAFVGRRPGDRGNHIFIQSADGGSRRQLTFEDSSDTSPAFSPGGSLLVFARSTTHSSGTFAYEWDAGDRLCVIDVDASWLRQISTGGLYAVDPRFSPNGKEIVFWDSTGLYLVAADGSSAPRSIAGLKGCHATFSPDGRMLLYAEGQYERDVKIFLAHVDGSGVRQLVSASDVDSNPSGSLYRPSFTPDGKRIIFLFRLWPDGPSGTPRSSLWEVEISGGRPRELTDYRLFQQPLSYFPERSD
jgi:Tol biopolymer transport system component